MQVEIAADAAVGADGGGDRLRGLVPGARLAHVVLARGHERAGRADADAVAAVDARGIRECHVELGGDAGLEAASPPDLPKARLRVRRAASCQSVRLRPGLV